jgi:anion-transporting  ArsA/GET3 family ATPase
MPLLDELLARRVLFVTGKGGTGKSTMAAALALIAARAGKRTLVVDVDARGDVSRFLGAGPAGYKAKQAGANLHHLAIHADAALEEYLRLQLKLPRLYRIGPMNRVLEFIAEAAPGVEEVLIAGKIAFEERAKEGTRPRWDLIVVDAAPAGQVLSHIRGPRTLMDMVSAGMIRVQTEWVRQTLEDPAKTGIVVVSLPEEMPVTETEELLERTPKEVATPVVCLVANKVVAPPAHAEAIESIRRKRDEVALAIDVAFEAVDLMSGIAESQAPHLERLRELGPSLLEVPSLVLGRHTLQATRRVADALS